MLYTSFWFWFWFFAFVKSGKALHLPNWQLIGRKTFKKAGLAPRKGKRGEEGREAMGALLASLFFVF
jgi:hypothetical protein